MKEEAAIPHRPMLHIGRCTLAATMENMTFTAYAWDDGLIICRATFDDKEEAIQFAQARNWEKVEDDQTGEVIWHR